MTEATDLPEPELAPANLPEPEPEIEQTEPNTELETTDDDQSTATAEGDPAEETQDAATDAAKRYQADYTRKTQEVAEIRKSLEARQQRLDAVVQQGEALAAALSEEFQADFKDVNWGELAANDPAEYVRKQHAMTMRQGKLQAALYRLNEARQAQAQANQQTTQERLKQEQASLIEHLPEWKDAKRYAAESAEVSEYLTQAGYQPDEVSGVTDHRAVILARKAMLYDRMVAKAPKPQAVPKAPPPIQKAATKAAGPKDITQMSDREFAEYRRRQIAQRR